MPRPARGEVWIAEPPRALSGREQLGRRSVLVVSVDEINESASGLSVVVPFTTRDCGIDLHVRVDPPEGGLSERSLLLPEQIHAADQSRLVQLLGTVSHDTLRQLEDRLRIVLGLSTDAD